jgi:hypothetical protein
MATAITDIEIFEPGELVPAEVVESPTVQSLNERAIALLAEAHGLKITDDDSDLVGADVILRAKSLRKELGKARSDATTPFERTKKAIIAWFQAHDAPLEKVEREVGQQHISYQRRKDEAARKEQERLRLLAEKRQAKAAAKAEAKGEEPPAPIIPMPTVQAPAKTVKTAAGSLTTKVEWKFEVIDFAALPDEYKVPDAVKLGKVVRAGVREIPGVSIFSVETLGGRS